MVEALFLQSTSSLASPSRLYPVEIDVPHHQLRNFISTTYHDKIFYVNKYDIFVLDLTTCQRSIVVTVPFEARCLAAAHGWVCVGGEAKGDCAFVNIGEEDGHPGTFCHELLVECIGSEIVNSVTIQLLKPDLEEQHTEVVVLLSNNDKAVTIYSLTQRTALACIEHPKAMNYAMLSPDTTILAAVGDENKIYFLKRSQDEPSTDSHSTLPLYPVYDWRPIAAPDLPMGVQITEDFCFSITFSPDGKWCAVSSQGGCITIFDMKVIEDEPEFAEDAMVCTFRSSRASLLGCVRSMAFSPRNWDLLAWAEDHGRIGIADVRQGYLRRQHCSLRKDDFERKELEDQRAEEWKSVEVKDRLSRQHQQRMQALRGHPPQGARSFRDFSRAVANRSAQEAVQPVTSGYAGALESRGDDRELISTSNVSPYSINYDNFQPRINPSASDTRLHRTYQTQLLNPSVRSIETNMPRRRSSVVLSQSQQAQQLAVPENITRTTMTASPGAISDEPLPPLMSTNDLTPSAGSYSQPLPYNITPSDSLQDLGAELARIRAVTRNATWTQAGLGDIESSIIAERQLLNRIDRHLENERRLSHRLATDLMLRERARRGSGTALPGSEPVPDWRSPSHDLLLHRQLLTERDSADRRIEELELESRLLRHRMTQLQEEGTIIQRHYANHQSSMLVTPPQSSSGADTESQIRRRIQDINDDRRARTDRIYLFEQDLRRAQSRIEVSRLQNRTSDPTIAGSTGVVDITMPPTHSFSSLTMSGHTPADARRIIEAMESEPRQSPMIRRLRHQETVAPVFASTRATLPRPTEPSEESLRMTRMMFARHSADGNGNYSSAAFQRYVFGSGVQIQGGTSEEALADRGVGTAGIGWSPDGLKIFVGSCEGIFEFDLNVQDRLQCPLIEVR